MACAIRCSRSRPAISGTGRTASGISSRSSAPRRSPTARIDAVADKPARLSLPVKWGRYRLEVSSPEPNGAITSLSFDAGFYAESSADTPDLLEVALDRPDYKSGDTMNVAVTARTAGRLTLNVFTDRLVSSTAQDVKPGTANVKLGIGKDWGTGAYLVATLRRPLDAPAQRMPGRAIGVQWFSIDRTARTLAARAWTCRPLRPNSTLAVPVRVAGLAAGDEARVVVAAVDVGILNLTNYKPPAPDDYYLGQRRLTAGNSRHLRATDRRHAGRAPAKSAPAATSALSNSQRLAADAGAARALFRHRHRRPRRRGAGCLRHSGLRRHACG